MSFDIVTDLVFTQAAKIAECNKKIKRLQKEISELESSEHQVFVQKLQVLEKTKQRSLAEAEHHKQLQMKSINRLVRSCDTLRFLLH